MNDDAVDRYTTQRQALRAHAWVRILQTMAEVDQERGALTETEWMMVLAEIIQMRLSARWHKEKHPRMRRAQHAP